MKETTRNLFIGLSSGAVGGLSAGIISCLSQVNKVSVGLLAIIMTGIAFFCIKGILFFLEEK